MYDQGILSCFFDILNTILQKCIRIIYVLIERIESDREYLYSIVEDNVDHILIII